MFSLSPLLVFRQQGALRVCAGCVGTKQNVLRPGRHASLLRRPFASHLHLRHSTVAPQQTHAVAPRLRCRCVDTQVSALGAARRLCRLLLRAHAPREHGQRQDDGRRQLRAPLRLHSRDVALLEPHGGRWNRTPLSPAPLRPRPWRLRLWSARAKKNCPNPH